MLCVAIDNALQFLCIHERCVVIDTIYGIVSFCARHVHNPPHFGQVVFFPPCLIQEKLPFLGQLQTTFDTGIDQVGREKVFATNFSSKFERRIETR